MGSVFPDFTGDGIPELVETAIYYAGACGKGDTLLGCSGNRLFVGEGDGTFRDVTNQYDVRDGGWGWGAAAEDFNNSGRLSIVQVAGMVWTETEVTNNTINPYYGSSGTSIRRLRGSG